MKMRWLSGLSVALLCLVTCSVGARTWFINGDGTGDALTIQAGLDSSQAGDTVLVACGTYFEADINMKSGVRLMSETSSPDCVVIDAQLLGSAILCETDDGSTAIEGLTLTNASQGAIRLRWSYDTVENCIFKSNTGPLGTAVDIWQSAAHFHDCLFYENYSTTASYAWTVNIAIGSHVPTFSNCTFSENSAGFGFVYDGAAYIENCIIVFCAEGPSIGGEDGANPMLSCTNLFGNAGGDWIPAGNSFSADPQFCGLVGSHNYYLQSDSPCVPGNHPNGDACGLIGALPVLCGSVKTESRTWGNVKALYGE
jgi:hypothetical protein